MTKLADGTPLASPACSMHEADPAYMGYASEDELVTFLNELLEAETAGARVTLASAREAGDGPIAGLMQSIHRDEAHWCAMLIPHIKLRGATPSPKIGAFYEKAMAIADLGERIAFLNRGQGWWCENYVRYCRACVMKPCIATSRKCCDRMKPTSASLMKSRPPKRRTDRSPAAGQTQLGQSRIACGSVSYLSASRIFTRTERGARDLRSRNSPQSTQRGSIAGGFASNPACQVVHLRQAEAAC